MSARRKRSSLKAHVAGTAVYMRAMQSSLFTQLIKLPLCRSYKASDTELEPIKQWAIDEAQFEPSNPPANTPQPPPAKKACTGPLDVLRHTGAPAPTSSASAASLVDAELSAYLQAEVFGR